MTKYIIERVSPVYLKNKMGGLFYEKVYCYELVREILSNPKLIFEFSNEYNEYVQKHRYSNRRIGRVAIKMMTNPEEFTNIVSQEVKNYIIKSLVEVAELRGLITEEESNMLIEEFTE
ncbi:MAG: hypothetical protein PUE08_01515 [Eubacteriales bacterium]|nr:hypothetical protein [Eubacteriales bacterium]